MIELKKVSAGYGLKSVLKCISLKFSKGKLIAVIGTNGSGKSTLLKTVAGIVKTESGNILIDGISSMSMSRKDLSKKVAYLAQGKSIPDMTVAQMVLHGRFPHIGYPRRYGEQDRAIAAESMNQMKIGHLADSPISALSGGMRQKAYIAMALTQDTEYILLDEPTTYLDISNQVELMHILRALADSGKGIIAVMHDLELAFTFSDTIAVLNNGTIQVCDSPSNVSAAGIVKDDFGIDLQYSSESKSYHYRYPIH